MTFDGYACRQSDGNMKGDCFILEDIDPTIEALGNSFVSMHNYYILYKLYVMTQILQCVINGIELCYCTIQVITAT